MGDLAYDDDGEGWSAQLQALLLQKPSICFRDVIETIGPQVPAYAAARHWHRRRGDEFSTERQRLHLLLGDTLAQLGAVAAPLASHAEEIERQFRSLDAAVQEVAGLRVATGRALIAGRAAVDAEHGPGHWGEWCRENIRRSQGDIRKLMQLAGAQDPDAAVTEEREKARVGMARQRANVSAVERRVVQTSRRTWPRRMPPPEVAPRSERPLLRVIEPTEPVTPPEPEIEPAIALRLGRLLPEPLRTWAVGAAADDGMSLAAWIIDLVQQEKVRRS